MPSGIRHQRPFHIDAWVVLPDHMHCMWSLPEGDTDYPLRWRLIKLLFSKGLPKTERLSAVRKRRSERGIYPQGTSGKGAIGTYDTRRAGYARHVDYNHLDQLKHGHVNNVADWPYSSFHRYVAKGLLPADWCGALVDLTTAWE